MLGVPPPPAAPRAGFDVWWVLLGKIVRKLMAERAHGDVVIILKDGAIQRVNIQTSYLPDALPRV